MDLGFIITTTSASSSRKEKKLFKNKYIWFILGVDKFYMQNFVIKNNLCTN